MPGTLLHATGNPEDNVIGFLISRRRKPPGGIGHKQNYLIIQGKLIRALQGSAIGLEKGEYI